ncbi:MAG: glycosyltransferase family 39 protein [Deltaproteobacteria bacterium]|nr:glycosyltransferase family 39 protein [Deltaproteobacteria bacterium]
MSREAGGYAPRRDWLRQARQKARAQRGEAERSWVVWVLGVVLLLFGLSLCRRGIILSDEGYLLLQSVDMVHGKVLYRDMDAFVAPGVWFLLSGLFSVVEPSVLASRMAALACYAATAWTCWRIVLRLTDRRFALAAVGVLMVFTVWAFPAWTWSFYSPYAVLFSLAALERVLAWRADSRARDLVWIGVFVGLAITFKQNYGVLALAGCGIAIAAIRLEGNRSLLVLRELPALGARVALGMAAVGLPCLAYFAYHGALVDVFRQLVVQPFGGFLGQHDIPYLLPSEFLARDLMADGGRLTYGAFALTNAALRFDWHPVLVRGIEMLHVLLYWLPPLVFAVAAVLVFAPLRRGRSPDTGLAAALAVGGLVFLGVFPRADYNHLVNVYQPAIVVGVVTLHRLWALRGAFPRRGVRLAVGLGGLLLALYAGIAVYWYADLLGSLREPIATRRGGVLVSLASKQMIDFEVSAIRSGTRPGEAVLTLPGFAMLNFLAERPMPSRYYNLYAVHIAHDEGAGVVEGAEARRVRLVLADYHDFFSETVGLRQYAPQLVKYLRRFFTPFFSVAIDEHLFLRRRPRPLPDLATRSPLEECDVGEFDWQTRGIRDHLLFQTLYHPVQYVHDGEQEIRRHVSTLCRIRVPDGARLAFAVGYRQPTTVSEDVLLTAEIWARRLADPDPQRIFREEMKPLPATGWASPPPLERRVDLAAFAGEEILLTFRTLFQGEVAMNALDSKGFAMTWQDPQIEYEERPR